jgi:hypothetical protein
MESMEDFFGEPISVCTDQDAIDDGQLVVVDEDRFPGCLFTHGVHTAIMEKVNFEAKKYGINKSRSYMQIAFPLMMDVIMVAKQNPNESLYTGNALEGNATGKTLWFGMNGIGGITVMFPEER